MLPAARANNFTVEQLGKIIALPMHMESVYRPHISIFGLGYVGCVTAACFAHAGHRVLGVDPNPEKARALSEGRSPIVEPEVDKMLAMAKRAGLIDAVSDPVRAIQETDISFISVGTPSLRNGNIDLSHVEAVCQQIGRALRGKDAFHWILLRSTVLPGTTETLVVPLIERMSGKRMGDDFGVCFNPEFLREGSAVADFFHPPFTVLGAPAGISLATIRDLYRWLPGETYEVPAPASEMIKYVCNAFHALKVSFANEIGSLCQLMGIDPKLVSDIYTSDTRLNISKAYLTPGFAFGGSCLPKDLRAITYHARRNDLRLPLLEAILPSNDEHLDRAFDSIMRLGRRRVGIIGLSFKAGTDDLRESPIVILAKRLLGEGCQVHIWDEKVALGQLIGSNRQFIEAVIPHIGSLLCADHNQVIEEAEVVVFGNSVAEKQRILETLRSEQVVVDLTSLQPSTMTPLCAVAG